MQQRAAYKSKSFISSIAKSTSSKQQQKTIEKSSIQLSKDISIDKDNIIKAMREALKATTKVVETLAKTIINAIERSKKLENKSKRENENLRSRLTCLRRFVNSRSLTLTTIFKRSRRRNDETLCETRIIKDQRHESTRECSTHSFTHKKSHEISSRVLLSSSNQRFSDSSTRYL